MVLNYDEIIRKTDKAVLVRVGLNCTWLPLKHCHVRTAGYFVPDWIDLVWQVDKSHIDYVCTDEEKEEIKEWLLRLE